MLPFVRILGESEMENDWDMWPQLTCTHGRHVACVSVLHLHSEVVVSPFFFTTIVICNVALFTFVVLSHENLTVAFFCR